MRETQSIRKIDLENAARVNLKIPSLRYSIKNISSLEKVIKEIQSS